MSDSQAYDPVMVSSDGVTVAKRFEADEFPVPAIAFRIESRRTEPVTITLVDTVPEDVAVEDLGFHPEYGSEHWTIDDQQIIFEREIEAESEYTTVYGIRSTGTDDVEKFLTEPTIEQVDPPLEDEGDVLNESSSDVVKDVIAGESDSVPGLDADEDEEIETLDLKDPNAPDAEVGQADAADAAGGEGGPDQSNLTTTLLAEIHHGAVDEDVVRALRQELSLDGADSGATDARIQHLQNEVSDLAAYTETLEEFLAENGTGEQLIADFRSRLGSFEDELDRIQRLTMENDEEIGEVRSEVGEMSDQMSGVEDTVSSVEGTVEAVEGTVEEVEGTVETLDSQVGEIDEEVDSLGEDVNGMDEHLATLEGEIDSLRGELEEVDSRVSDVGDVDDRIDDIETEIEDLKQWREQLSSVIGGGE
ncbi:hypothetical protein [Halapricum hydrolyticum]|uniref:t-SNARE coiled-coil homology domain-containing protein n=1 Tax=Halapricum hydrolyticum TaxID=2979991 RepID=A0AAE3IAJ0_9EURY|nr:hypothetical protein [Halapricum hydrolyticum]MCU4717202.1 hypothetical protein [Halapricum hydrolyticum]MCU4726129.1 hypothetical protein [Halapricum hydrolyticum]